MAAEKQEGVPADHRDGERVTVEGVSCLSSQGKVLLSDINNEKVEKL